MRERIDAAQYAQVDNHDPFAPPVWRSPVHRTPEPVIWLVQLLRLALRTIWFLIRHPLLALAAAATAAADLLGGWHVLVVLAAAAVTVLAGLRLWRPAWYQVVVTRPLRDRWRWQHYRRRWRGVVTVAGLAPAWRGQVAFPVLGKVRAGRCIDLASVRLVPGQSPGQVADRASHLAHGLGVLSCRVRTGPPGGVILELVRADALAQPIPALPVPAVTDLRALPVGRREDGELLAIRLHGTHLLIAGATGAGKGSYLWGLVRAMLPAMTAGLVLVHACDPKLMELAYGRPLFERFGCYAAGPDQIAAQLEADVTGMQQRAARFAGLQRDHTPTAEHPFTVILVDEVAFLTAYQPDRKLRERTLAALATLTTQGRAVGFCVVAALQDPRKEVLNIRNLFPDKIALRLDEPSQADLVLGDGARDHGALCDQISADPATGAGVGYMRLETSPDPVRVRAAWVTDDDIAAMTAAAVQPDTPAGPVLAAGLAAEPA
ncbi:MAG: FtsK/SpoIIIE domain-containing protein [Streptosporangiaceae bacterium]